MLWLTRLLIARGLASIYLIAFIVARNQFIPLCGQNGLLPVPEYLKRIKFWQAPSIFHFYYSDRFASIFIWVGICLSLLNLSGFADKGGLYLYTLTWFLLWAIYLSFVNVGQTFYAFGWESLLLETGFLAIFLGPSSMEPSVIVIWLMRWVLFRVMFGAGLIKLRGDRCWRDLTCLVYHYETQPMPNPLSYYLHRLPVWFHKAEVLATHAIELVLPFFYFAPYPIADVAGVITILFQVTLIASGNLSWLNYLTIVLCFSCLGGSTLTWFPMATPLPILLLLCLVAALSIRPIVNMISSRQLMNASFDPLHLVNTYGAFGSVEKQRFEVIIEGTEALQIDQATIWHAYEFRAKPGDINRRPPFVAPYHLRLDWLMWFAAMSNPYFHPWFLRLIEKLLSADKQVLKLLAKDPFCGTPPMFVRARLYRYQFALENLAGKNWWKRTIVSEYLPPVRRD